MTPEEDRIYMARAIALAHMQAGRTGHNPAVGCVIIDATGAKISEGATGDGGKDHAEALALLSLDRGAASGGTVYVTLEPCRERSAGGTSCSELLLEAGIDRLVCAIADAHPNGAGGFDRLREAGVTVEVGLMATEAEMMYRDFFAST